MLLLLREVCNLVIIERGMREAEKALLGTSPGSNVLKQFIVKELIENLSKVSGVSVEAVGEKAEGNEGGTDGGNEGGKKAKATVSSKGPGFSFIAIHTDPGWSTYTGG